jgi:hypothetical protein
MDTSQRVARSGHPASVPFARSSHPRRPEYRRLGPSQRYGYRPAGPLDRGARYRVRHEPIPVQRRCPGGVARTPRVAVVAGTRALDGYAREVLTDLPGYAVIASPTACLGTVPGSYPRGET